MNRRTRVCLAFWQGLPGALWLAGRALFAWSLAAGRLYGWWGEGSAVRPRLPVWIFGVAVLVAGQLSLVANDPGGGTNGLGANVTLTTSSSAATLANGVITAVIDKASGKVTSYLFGGKQMLDTSGLIYYSMDGGSSYEQPGNCLFSVLTNSADMVDISCKVIWSNNTNRVHAFDIDVHYVLRRGDSGLYAYAILSHPAEYPASSVGEWRMVWKLPHDSTYFTFERVYVDAMRNWYWGTYKDFTAAQSTGIAEVVKLVTGARAGQYDCKYEYSGEYQTLGCWGHASDTNRIGVWMVPGGFDFFNDGPTKNELTLAESYLLMHFGRNHYNGSSTSVAANESWSKIYGPFLLYCNQTAVSTNAGDALWADAKAQAQAEQAAWPYAWLAGNTNYPPESGRGAVSGKLIVKDSLKPSVTASNAWVGLAQVTAGGNWQFESKHYQYWGHADAGGNFVIPHVRPGTYTLYAFTVGAVGEYSQVNVTVSVGATNALGDLTWAVPHAGGKIAWELGIPDRTAAEFRHGTNYWYPFLWDQYSSELPNPLEYTVGVSNWTNDWNYAHAGYEVGTNWFPWKWRIHFTLTNLAASGDARLTLAWASANYGAVQIFVNDESTLLADVSPSCYGGPTGGNALIREGIHAKYGVDYVSIPVALLQNGSNTITLLQRRSSASSDHVMYDYLSLEVPLVPQPPPGRLLYWRGGNAANAWDINSTLNWVTTNGTPTVFTNGDNVVFDDSGSNNVPISLNTFLLPGSVTVNAARNYNFGGSGSLGGTMALLKAGSGTLTLTASNSFAGGTRIAGGSISLANDTANQYGLGEVFLDGGTLQMYDNANSYNSSYWDINVPVGSTGAFRADARCDLYGALKGGGTLNFYVPYVRTTLYGDWSDFSGTVNVRSDADGGEFRVQNFNGYGRAAISLGNKVSAYFNGTVSSSGTTLEIGELSGAGSATLKGGPAASGSRPFTWRIGGRGTDAVFAGNIQEQAVGTTVTALAKVGAGVWTLSGTNTYAGLTSVAEGTLQVLGSLSNDSQVIVSASATLDLRGVLSVARVQIDPGGFLTGCGTIHGTLLNNGTVLGNCGAGQMLSISGNVTNNGTMQLLGGTALQVAGLFVNNGVLDLITGASGLPSNFINNGTVLDSTNVRVLDLRVAGTDVIIRIQSYVGHSYRLQWSPTLRPAAWQTVAAPQDGTGDLLTFTDPSAASGPAYYRIEVSP